MDFEKLMPMIVAKIDQDRAKEARGRQLTLGDILLALVRANPELPVYLDRDCGTPGDLISYRGYYSDLAIERGSKEVLCGAFAESLEATIGKTFEGYKGGDYTMSSSTLVWVSEYGDCTSMGVSGVNVNPYRIVLETANMEED